ncbi:MAG: radical SAM protein, partial [bacterium]
MVLSIKTGESPEVIKGLRKILLKTGYTCNNNCIFCHSVPFRAYPDLSYRELTMKIRSAVKAGAEMVVFSGGEPTIRRDIVALSKKASEMGLAVGLVTNGRMLGYESFLEQLLENGLSYILLSLHGSSEEIHDALVRCEGFHQAIQSLRLLRRHGVFVTVNVVVNKFNIGDLRNIVDRVFSEAPANLKFSFPEPKGAVLERFDELVPSIREAAEVVEDAMRYADEKSGGEFFIGCDGFTPCLIANYDRRKDDLFTHNYLAMSETFEEGFFEPDYGD